MAWSRRRAFGCAGAALGVVVLGVLFAGANVAAQLNGGWDEVFDFTKTQPDDPEVVAAREEGAALADTLLDEALDEAVLPGIGPQARVAEPPGDPGERIFGRSGCELGQHNWKRDDPFDVACSEVRRAIVVGPEADLDTQLARIEENLIALGWRAEGRPPGARLPGDPIASALPTAYSRAGSPYSQLYLAFDAMDLRTDAAVPAPGSGEYPVEVQVRVQSFQG